MESQKICLRRLTLVMATAFLVCLLLACTKEADVSSSIEPSFVEFDESGDGWVSSGGELTKDSQNPWWVVNTKEVTFCIAVDKETVTVDEGMVEYAFRGSAQFWKKEFESYSKLLNQAMKAKTIRPPDVAQAAYRRVGCDESPDLRLLFGYGTLSKSEKRIIKETDRIVARAIRTHYDRVNLKGRGFIYFASDRGDHALDQQSYKEFWTIPEVLVVSITHELGHIFGIPHVMRGNRGQRANIDVMHEDTLDGLFFAVMLAEDGKAGLVQDFNPGYSLNEQKTATDAILKTGLSRFFEPMVNYSHGSIFQNIQKGSRMDHFFELFTRFPTAQHLLVVYQPPAEGKKVSESAYIEVKVLSDEDILVGTFRDLHLITSFKQLSLIHLTHEQKVYPFKNSEFMSIGAGAGAEFEGSALFYPAGGGEPKPAHVELHFDGEIRFFGSDKGAVFPLHKSLHGYEP